MPKRLGQMPGMEGPLVRTTQKVTMAGSDHHRLTVLRVKFSYSGPEEKVFRYEKTDVK